MEDLLAKPFSSETRGEARRRTERERERERPIRDPSMIPRGSVPATCGWPTGRKLHPYPRCLDLFTCFFFPFGNLNFLRVWIPIEIRAKLEIRDVLDEVLVQFIFFCIYLMYCCRDLDSGGVSKVAHRFS